MVAGGPSQRTCVGFVRGDACAQSRALLDTAGFAPFPTESPTTHVAKLHLSATIMPCHGPTDELWHYATILCRAWCQRVFHILY